MKNIFARFFPGKGKTKVDDEEKRKEEVKERWIYELLLTPRPPTSFNPN